MDQRLLAVDNSKATEHQHQHSANTAPCGPTCSTVVTSCEPLSSRVLTPGVLADTKHCEADAMWINVF